jgi:hypothetical protein
MPQSRESLGSGYHAAVERGVKNLLMIGRSRREREKPVSGA